MNKDDDFSFAPSPKQIENKRKLISAMIENYEAANADPKPEPSYNNCMTAAGYVLEATSAKKKANERYVSYVTSVKDTLVTEALYKLFSESIDPKALESRTNRNIMRAIVTQYVHENTSDDILSKMRYASPCISEMSNAIEKSYKKIIESTNSDDPSTFTITPEMKDDFFASLDFSDTEAISDAIKQRVADATQDFVNANNKDHEDINDTLKAAQEKINAVPDDEKSEELRESYNAMANRKINDIRLRPKGVLHSMVAAMCEGILKHQQENAEFILESGHLDVEKIIDRNIILYNFIEMVNTARIDNIDEEKIAQIVKGLAE